MNKKTKLVPMTFEVEGGDEFDPLRLPKAVKSSIEVLAKLQDGKLLRRSGLSNRIGLSSRTIDSHTTHPALRDFKMVSKSGIVYFGNQRTIEAARLQFDL